MGKYRGGKGSFKTTPPCFVLFFKLMTIRSECVLNGLKRNVDEFLLIWQPGE